MYTKNSLRETRKLYLTETACNNKSSLVYPVHADDTPTPPQISQSDCLILPAGKNKIGVFLVHY